VREELSNFIVGVYLDEITMQLPLKLREELLKMGVSERREFLSGMVEQIKGKLMLEVPRLKHSIIEDTVNDSEVEWALMRKVDGRD